MTTIKTKKCRCRKCTNPTRSKIGYCIGCQGMCKDAMAADRRRRTSDKGKTV